MKNKKQLIGVIGLGRFGMPLAIELIENGMDVICCDLVAKKVQTMLQYTPNAFIVEELNEDTLLDMGMDKCDVVVNCIGENVSESILTTLTLKKVGVEKIISKAVSDKQGAILKTLGSEVVYPERDMALRTAVKIAKHNVMEFLDLSDSVEISEILIPQSLVGKSIIESNFRKNFSLNIIAIDHNNKIETDISPTYVFEETDKVVVIGDKGKVALFKEHK